jgi:hypothetical protein
MDGLINIIFFLVTILITAALHSAQILLCIRCFCNTLLIISADAEKKYRLYKIKQQQNLLEAMMHFNMQDVHCCPCFMDNVLEALHSHKNYFNES